ncbi:MAG: dTMP kinase [Acidobacteriota bacterium]
MTSNETSRRGLFITLEGVEGCGKSTQARRLVERWRARGRSVRAAREPGGTPLAEQVRSLLLDPAQAGMPAAAELLLMTAARADHVTRVLEPALAAGEDVVCDRFSDSTRAYQGAARGLPDDVIATVDGLARGGLVPDATLLLDIPAEVGLERARTRNADDDSEGRLDGEALSFHRRVRSGFLRLARNEPTRIWVLDASGDEDDVAERIDRALARALPESALVEESDR